MKKNDKDLNDPWSHEEDISLCKALVDLFENSVEGYARKAFEFWWQLVVYFEKEMMEGCKIQEVRPMGRDMFEKKASSSFTARLDSSTPGEVGMGIGTGRSEASGGSELKRLKLAQEERM
nr:hypothetical protein [Tanacetum cinerariifolium]